MSEEKLQVFELFFNPKSIAIIGTSKNPKSLAVLFLRGLLSAGFKGELYPVGNSGGMIEGITIHPDLGLIPGDVDYAIACVPSSKLPDVLDECAAKGIKAVHVFTGGFSENCEEGRENEIEMVAKARALGIRIIGPNCVGICSPANNMSLQPFPPSLILKGEPGTVAFMAQSGRIAFEIIEHGMSRGIYFSKVVGFGNGCDLNSADFMEYFALDPATRVIGAYVEGTTDGSRLTRSVREASTNKPVVILKGGQTEAGARAASSHTGSLAISYTAWQVALRQAGAIVVETIEEMADTLMAFQNTTTLQGNRAAIITGIWAGGGGMSVAATDAMARHGLDVPFFTGE
ncbi:MAG: CoA-binding protein, partial [Chloroflexota bacterium]|nr:CoA-binding protein [Chloroflexota bacterium]